MTTDQTVGGTFVQQNVVSVVVSDWLNVSKASRHCIIEIYFTHHFSHNDDIVNNHCEVT